MAESKSNMNCEVLIAGGGMVGGALAAALADLSFKVVVVELKKPARGWPEDEVDLRVSALTRASEQVLRNLGVWERMAELRVSPYREMHVWDAGGSGAIHFDAADVGEPDLGHIVENRVTQLALWERLEALEHVDLICPDTIESIENSETGCRILLASGVEIDAALLVGAEGATSPVRDMAAITSSGWAYDQHAIVATIWPEKHHGEVARQRFMTTGPLAFLPIDDGRCSIVWSTSPQEAEQLMAMNDGDFCDALTSASERMLGRIQQIGPRGVFPLRLRNADNYVKPGLALVGDAAHGIHPLAGQGVNLGLLDAATLVDVLVEARESGRALGSMATLRRYERARKGENIAMLGAMDGFKRLFSNDNPPLTLVRNLGLNLMNASGPVKHLIIKRALGLVGGRARLASQEWSAQ